MMALQLPEPDYYTLAEVLERWGITEDVLLRLAAEGKIELGYITENGFETGLIKGSIKGFLRFVLPDSGLDDSMPPVPRLIPYVYGQDGIIVRISDLVIRTTEVHRIEHQREAAKKAADDDVLGTRERETMQAVIAAQTQFIANTAQKYRHGDRPNVDAIAGALEGMIPDREKGGLAKQ